MGLERCDFTCNQHIYGGGFAGGRTHGGSDTCLAKEGRKNDKGPLPQRADITLFEGKGRDESDCKTARKHAERAMGKSGDGAEIKAIILDALKCKDEFKKAQPSGSDAARGAASGGGETRGDYCGGKGSETSGVDNEMPDFDSFLEGLMDLDNKRSRGECNHMESKRSMRDLLLAFLLTFMAMDAGDDKHGSGEDHSCGDKGGTGSFSGFLSNLLGGSETESDKLQNAMLSLLLSMLFDKDNGQGGSGMRGASEKSAGGGDFMKGFVAGYLHSMATL